MLSRRRNLLATRNGRFLTFSILYISEGIPYGFTSVAMVAFMRQQGVSLELIGAFVAALFLPWAFKWAWAPLIDLIKLPRLGGRKAWILFCTAMMIVTLMITASIDFVAHFELLLAMIVLNNLFCATQDVAIDSLAVSTLRESERGRGSGFMFAGQYFGIALGGGGAVFVYGLFGFEATLAYISALLLLNLLFVLLYVRDPQADPDAVPQADVLKKLVHSMISFTRDVYAGFWKSGSGPMFGVLFSLLRDRVIDERRFGQEDARLALEQAEWTGTYMDNHVNEAIEWSKKTHNVEFITLSKEEKAVWDAKLQFLTDKWVKGAKEKGLPADAIVSDIKAFVSQRSK